MVVYMEQTTNTLTQAQQFTLNAGHLIEESTGDVYTALDNERVELWFNDETVARFDDGSTLTRQDIEILKAELKRQAFIYQNNTETQP